MITPHLEKLIWEGKADSFSYAIGGSGVGIIPFPKGARAIIVTDFLWHPFTDQVINEGDNPDTFLKKLVHTISLWNKTKKSIYNFRDVFAVLPTASGETVSPIFQSPTLQPCYFHSKEDIRINIWNFERGENITWNYDSIPATTQEQITPNGYGNETAVRSITTANGNQIIPLTRGVDPGAIPTPPGFGPGQRQRFEFFEDITPETVLIRPNEAGYSFPLVNFNCVVIYDRPNGVFP